MTIFHVILNTNKALCENIHSNVFPTPHISNRSLCHLLTYNYLDPLTMVMPRIVATQLVESVAQVTVTNADEIMRVRRGLWANRRVR